MERADTPATAGGDNLDRLLALLEAARAEEAKWRRVDLRTACRDLLAAIERTETVASAA